MGRHGQLLAVADQALYAGTHFIAHVLLARWMEPTTYGAFALIFTSFQLLLVLYNGLVAEPVLVFGASRFRLRWPAYFGCVLRAQWSFVLVSTVAATAGIGVMWWARGFSALRLPELLAIPAMTLVLGVLLMRRAALAQFMPRVAVLVSCAYLLITSCGLVLLRHRLTGNAWGPWVAMGIGGLAAGIVGAVSLDSKYERSNRRLASIWARHWRYGKWVVVSGLLGFLANGLNPYLIAAFRDLTELGSYRAVLNLAMPGLQTCAALTIHAIPRFAAVPSNDLSAVFRRYALGFSALFGLYAAIVVLLGDPLLSLLYGDHGFSYDKLTVMLAGLTPLVYLPLGLFGALLRAKLLTRAVTAGAVVTGAVALVGGLPLVITFGVNGAMLTTVLAYTGGGGYLIWRSQSLVRNE